MSGIVAYFNQLVGEIPFNLATVTEIIKTILIALLKLLPVITFSLLIGIVGYNNLEECPLKPDIPLYLFVSGKFFKLILFYLKL